MIEISYKKMLTMFHATFHFQRKYCCFEITKPFLTVAQETKWLLSKSDWTYLAAIFCRKWKCDSVVLSNLSVRNPRVFSYDWLLAAYPNFTCSGYVIIGFPLFQKSCLTDYDAIHITIALGPYEPPEKVLGPPLSTQPLKFGPACTGGRKSEVGILAWN